MAEYLIGETLGFEFETDNIFKRGLKLPPGFKIVSDASVETNGQYNLEGIPILFPNGLKAINIAGVRKEVKGVEIVSNSPLVLDESLQNKINQVLQAVLLCGETGRSVRSGIHFHITLPPSLSILKEVINIGAHLEDLFFWIAGMGYEFRGVENGGTYCRPITKVGPQCVRNNKRGFSQVFVVDDLLESKSVDDFKLRYGDVYSQMGTKYLPVRYSWLNLYSMFVHGSLEFRPFNITSNGYWIYAVARLCGFFVQEVLSRAYSSYGFEKLPQNSVYDNRPDEEIINTFLTFFPRLPDDIRNTILSLLEYTPRVKLKDEYNYTHLMFHAHGDKTRKHFNSVYCPPTIRKDKIVIPIFLDAHNIANPINVPMINLEDEEEGVFEFEDEDEEEF